MAALDRWQRNERMLIHRTRLIGLLRSFFNESHRISNALIFQYLATITPSTHYILCNLTTRIEPQKKLEICVLTNPLW